MTEPRRVFIEAECFADGISLMSTKEELEAHPREGPATPLPQSDVPPTRMQLTQGLRDDLKAWNQAWDDSDDGFWGDEEGRRAWEEQGRQLAIRVQDELGTDGWEVLYLMNGRVHRVHPPGSWSAYTWTQDLLGYTHPDPQERAEEEARVLEHARRYQQETGEPLPPVIELAPDYGASLPLWGENGNVAWQDTKFPPELLHRLAAWQQDFDSNFHYDTGWRSAAIRDHWANAATDLAKDVQAALGTRAELVVALWPLKEQPRVTPRIMRGRSVKDHVEPGNSA